VPLKESEAFVLRSGPLGESDRIVTFLTRAAGKIRGVAKGARRSRRRFGANLEPLSLVRLQYFEREGSDLARIETAELLESFFRLQEDPERAAALACVAEVADAFAREEQADEPFFRLVHAVLRAVRAGLAVDPALRYFEIWTLRLHGVLPDLERCGRCAQPLPERGSFYDRREGQAVCGRCDVARGPGAVPLGGGARRAIREILTRAPEALIAAPPAAADLGPLAGMAAAAFADLTEKRLRSYEVLARLRGRG
jgi:DNA repair protein RecO (recombination protein O)